jgi:hypothetical protein
MQEKHVCEVPSYSTLIQENLASSFSAKYYIFLVCLTYAGFLAIVISAYIIFFRRVRDLDYRLNTVLTVAEDVSDSEKDE